MSSAASAQRAASRTADGTGASGADRRYRAWLLGLLFVAFALRLAWALYAARNPVELNDPHIYLAQARGIAAGEGYRQIDGLPTAYFPIGYPAFLAAITWFVDHSPLTSVPRTAAVVQAVLGTISVWLVWRIAASLLGRRTALGAAGIVAVFPGLLLYSAPLLSETLFVTLELAAIAFLLAAPWTAEAPSWRRLAGFGVLTGLAALVRPQSLVLVLALAAALALTRVGWRRSLAAGCVAFAAAVLVIVPWTARNAITMKAFVPISTNTGDDLCIGHNSLAYGGFGTFPACADVPGKLGRERETARDAKNTRAAADYALHHPLAEVRLLRDKLHYLYLGDSGAIAAVESYGHDRFLAAGARSALKTVADVYFFVVLALAILGLPLLATRRDARRMMLLLATLAMAFMPLAFFGDMRFHVPASPLFAILAAAALARLLPSVGRRLRRPHASRPL